MVRYLQLIDCTMYNVQCAMNNVHCTLYNEHYIQMHIKHHCTVYIVYIIQCILYAVNVMMKWGKIGFILYSIIEM